MNSEKQKLGMKIPFLFVSFSTKSVRALGVAKSATASVGKFTEKLVWVKYARKLLSIFDSRDNLCSCFR